MRLARVLAALLPLAALTSAQEATKHDAAPPLPDSVPKDARLYEIRMMGHLAGHVAGWKQPDGTIHGFYEFNDRGRGPLADSLITLDAQGYPTRIETTGHDYYKGPADEHFAITDGVARWKSKAEDEQRNVTGEAFFLGMYGTPYEYGLLVRALLVSPTKKIAVLPQGEAQLAKLSDKAVAADGKTVTVSLYAVTGLDVAPQYVWLDENGDLFANGNNWFMVIRQGWAAVAP